jgi:hypothetical protein
VHVLARGRADCRQGRSFESGRAWRGTPSVAVANDGAMTTPQPSPIRISDGGVCDVYAVSPPWHPGPMGVADFDTKVALVVRDDLGVWQKLNVTAFLTSGLVANAGAGVVGDPYEDADGRRYLPMLRQPVLVFAATGEKLATVARRARERDVPVAIYTAELFATSRDEDNRAAVKAVATDDLELVGLALRAPHKAADAVLRGLKRHD